MLSELMTYGAVAAKVRAMYGKRLTDKDYEQMEAMKSVPEVAIFLRGHPLWGAALSTVDTTTLTRIRFEYILRRHFLLTYLRLFSHVRQDEQTILRFPVTQLENTEIMRFMRLAMNGRPEQYTYDLPGYFNRYSKIHYEELSAAITYDDMLSAVKETDFYEALSRIRPDNGGFPTYLAVETAMRRYSYQARYRLAQTKGGTAGRLLRRSIEIQVDWANILLIERMIHFYPRLLPEITAYLIPISGGLKASTLHELYTCPNGEQMRTLLLEKTPYRTFLHAKRELGRSLEALSSLYQLEFYRRHVAMDIPSLFTPVAFYHLFRIELSNLIHVIECVRYGMSPEESAPYLVLH